MTHEEAADALEGMATKELRFAHSGRLLKNENGSLMAECCEATAALLQYAARVLRSVASASADAEESAEEWLCSGARAHYMNLWAYIKDADECIKARLFEY